MSRDDWNSSLIRWPRRVTPETLLIASLAGGGSAVAVATGSLTPKPWLTFAALTAFIVALTVPLRLIAFGWGLLLPIYGMVGVAPIWLDSARLAGAVLILIRFAAETASGRGLHRWLIALCCMGSLMFTSALTTPSENIQEGAFTILSAVIAFGVGRRPKAHLPVLAGFANGAAISGCILLMQTLGVKNPALPLRGYERFQGLSSSAPRVSIELAIATVVFFYFALKSSGHTLALRAAMATGAALCVVALASSGGRSGLAGLGIALAVALARRVLRVKVIMLLGTTLILGYIIVSQYGIKMATLSRLTQNPTGSSADFDLSTGRADLFWKALNAFFNHPILGQGVSAFQSEYGAAPHFSPLNYAVQAGAIGLVAGLFMIGELIRLTVGGKSITSQTSAHLARPLAAVLLAMALLEPEGPFVGVGLVTVLMLAAAISSGKGVEKIAASKIPVSDPEIPAIR